MLVSHLLTPTPPWQAATRREKGCQRDMHVAYRYDKQRASAGEAGALHPVGRGVGQCCEDKHSVLRVVAPFLQCSGAASGENNYLQAVGWAHALRRGPGSTP